MSDTRDRRHQALRALLRRGDPLGDSREPTAAETERLRRLVLSAAVPAAPRPAWRWAASAAALALLLILAVRGRLDGPRDAPLAAPAAGAPASRQIHFQAPGGTQVVWILRPNSDF